MIKIIIHDFAGHPSPFALSKELSKKYLVYHLYFGNDYGPKANFVGKYKNLVINKIGSNINYSKKNLFSRFINDIIYGKKIVEKINQIKPDVIISGQCPTFSQELILNASRKKNYKFIYWMQDFYSIAVEKILKKKYFFFSYPINFLFKIFDKKQFKLSNHIIVITDDFKKKLNDFKISKNKISIIPNWGDLNNIFPKAKNYEFLKNSGLKKSDFIILYTGTLAEKHNPDLLKEIAKKNQNVKVVVSGVGSGHDKLKNDIQLPKNMKLLPLQPYNKFNNILNSADILLATLEYDAGEFSVPSKILNYLSAGKPIMLCAPKTNLASKYISESGSGSVFGKNEERNIHLFIQNIFLNKKLREKMSNNGRNYAEKKFSINEISLRFEKIIKETLRDGNE
ncbi:MAG: hypothetical protein CMB83_05650 [Flammeovirgaceae bacterium]|nr:hypothetical protein [Flammeovirgaceae bacterium]